jgi:hypothetical protein
MIQRFDKLMVELPVPKHASLHGNPLEVQDGPPEGFTPPDLPAELQLTAPLGPDIDAEMFKDIAKKLFK